jgi:aryl-alcohol dehydrogenase-like predicted oxidoreductase
VLATKYIVTTRPGRSQLGRESPQEHGPVGRGQPAHRLQTDYIDLLYLHAWDGTTPVEEVVRAMDDLVGAGKDLYAGIPAWQVSRMQAIADLRGWSPLVALQIEYSLIERTVERELIPMARELASALFPGRRWPAAY